MMLEVSKGIFCGDDDSYAYGWKRKDDWAIIHCAKEPHHRKFVGYTGRGCPKDNKEYYYAIRDNEFALNIVDVDNPEFFNMDSIKMAIGFAMKYHGTRNILFHCNEGLSRSPSITMLFLAMLGELPYNSLEEAENEFIKLYPKYKPREGIREHLKKNWHEYFIE